MLAALQEIGAALDADRLLRVHRRGVVAVEQSGVSLPECQENNDGERQTKTRSAAGPWERSARRQRPTGRPGPAGTASRVIGGGLRQAYQAHLALTAGAYPTLQTFEEEDGLWLLVRSAILDGLQREATFLLALPDRPGKRQRAWGFWSRFADHRWIGPRHTNFGDGTICAFAPEDGVWKEGEDPTTLVDVYSVWTLRHLHLELYGRWPGRQYTLTDPDPAAQAFYRRHECVDTELCACGSMVATYAECCKSQDAKVDFVQAATAFLKCIPGGFASRRPPEAITNFIRGQSALPRMRDL